METQYKLYLGGALIAVVLVLFALTQNDEPKAVEEGLSVTLVTHPNEVLFVRPTGCTELCDQLEPVVYDLSLQAGFRFRSVEINASAQIPGVMILGRSSITPLIPFDSEANARRMFCNEFKVQGACENATG